MNKNWKTFGTIVFLCIAVVLVNQAESVPGSTNATSAPYREGVPSDFSSLGINTNVFVRNSRLDPMSARKIAPAIRIAYDKFHKVPERGGIGTELGFPGNGSPRKGLVVKPKVTKGGKGIKVGRKGIKAVIVAIGAAIVGLFKWLASVSVDKKPPHEQDEEP